MDDLGVELLEGVFTLMKLTLCVMKVLMMLMNVRDVLLIWLYVATQR